MYCKWYLSRCNKEFLFDIKQTYNFDEISFEKSSLLPLYLCSKFTAQRNPFNVLPWFSRIREVHDVLIYGLENISVHNLLIKYINSLGK